MERKKDDFIMGSARSYLIYFLVFALVLVIFLIVAITATNDSERINTSYQTKTTSFSSDGQDLRMPHTCYFLDQKDTHCMGFYNEFIVNNLSNNNVNNLWQFEEDTNRTNVFAIRTKVPANNGSYLAYEGQELFLTQDKNKNIYWKIFWTGVKRQFKVQTLKNGNFLGRNSNTNKAELQPCVFKWRIVPTKLLKVNQIQENIIYTATFFSSDEPLVMSLTFPQDNNPSIRVFTCGFDFNTVGRFTFELVPNTSYYRIFMTISDQLFTMVGINKGEGKFPVTLVPFPNNINENENLVFWEINTRGGLFKMEPRNADPEVGVQYVLGLNDNVEIPGGNCHLIIKDIATFNPDRDFVLLSFL
jgi:hypothetical protein